MAKSEITHDIKKRIRRIVEKELEENTDLKNEIIKIVDARMKKILEYVMSTVKMSITLTLKDKDFEKNWDKVEKIFVKKFEKEVS